jgi:hypothetical protein
MPTNEFIWLRTRRIVVTISLSKQSIIQYRIFMCASISLSKSYNWAKFGVLDSIANNVETRWHIVPRKRNVYPSSRAFASFVVNPSIFRKRFTHGRKFKDAVVGSDLDWNNWSSINYLIPWGGSCNRKGNFSATTATVCCFTFPSNSLKKLAYFFH